MKFKYQGSISTFVQEKNQNSISSSAHQTPSSTANSQIQALPYPSSLLEEWIQSNLTHGSYQKCLNYLNKLSLEYLEQQPILMVFKAAAMLFCNYPVDSIRKILDRADEITSNEIVQGEILALKAKTEIHLGHINNCIQLSHKAHSKLGKDNIFFRKLLERNLGLAYTIKGDLHNSKVWFERLLLSGFKAKNFNDILASYHYLAYIHRIQGQLQIAGVIYRKALTFINQNNLQNNPFSIKLKAGYGNLLMQRHSLENAIAHFQQAILLGEITNPLFAQNAYYSLCEAFLRRSDIKAAYKILQQYHNQIGQTEYPYCRMHSEHAYAFEARINLEAGKIEQAYHWLSSSGYHPPTSDVLKNKHFYELGYSLPVAARIYIAKGMPNRAIELLSLIIPKFVHQDANTFLIRALNTLAIAYFQTGDSLKAKIIINKAIRLGQAEENLGDFIFFGKQLIPVLHEGLKNNKASEFSLKLISILTNMRENNEQSIEGTIRKPLSRREMDVLLLLSEGLTNQEIANSLFLSANTVKSHTIKIYRKLNVHNRKRAVRKARMLGILPDKGNPFTISLNSIT